MNDNAVNFESLVDLIYEASLVPEQWPDVLEQLSHLADGEGGMIFAAAPGPSQWNASPGIYERIERWTKSPYAQNNPRSERLIPNIESRFLTDLDRFTLEELENEPFYTQILRPSGMGWCVGTSIRAPSGDTVVISIEKAWNKGPVPRGVAEQLDEFRPHLARAGVLSGRIGLDRVRTAVATLEMIGLPAVAVTQTGRAVAVNAGFMASGSSVVIGARDQVQFHALTAQAMFLEAVRVAPLASALNGRSIAVAGTAAAPPLIAHVIPLRRAGLDIFTGAMSILFLTPLTHQSSPAPELLQALFDLTPTEARVASLLIDGQSVEAITRIQSVSINTIRTQLKAVFAKTGVQRQSELISLLGQRREGPGSSPIPPL